MANPTGKGLIPNKPGERRGGRKAGSPRDIRTLIREAAEAMMALARLDGLETGRDWLLWLVALDHLLHTYSHSDHLQGEANDRTS